MAGLSATSQNALRGLGYGNNVDPSASSIYGLGYASAGYDVKKMNESIRLMERELDEKIRQWNTGAGLDLIGAGFGNPGQQTGLIRDLTGFELDAPEKEEDRYKKIARDISMNTAARDVYTGKGSFRPETQGEREASLYKKMLGIQPMSGHNTLSFGPPVAPPNSGGLGAQPGTPPNSGVPGQVGGLTPRYQPFQSRGVRRKP